MVYLIFDVQKESPTINPEPCTHGHVYVYYSHPWEAAATLRLSVMAA